MGKKEEKKVAKLLAESEEMYRNLLNNICEAVFEIDASGIVRFISAGIERIIGYSPKELCGRNFIEFIYPEDIEFLKDQFQQVAQNILQPSEYRIVCKNGESRWISSSSRPIYREGEFRGLNGVLIDIHERKIAQQALQRQQELLQQAQKMEAIGTLAGGIAHDFNNLLMGIQGRASLMLMDSDSSHPYYAHLKGIEEHVCSASELTRQLLGLARGGKYEVRPTDLNGIIRRTVEMFGRTKKEIAISAKLEPGLWVVEIDCTQIEQVLLNLFVNAWQAMPRGGQINVDSQNLDLQEVDSPAFQVRPGRYVRVGVSDTGVGMNEEIKNRIFDPFFTTKEMGRGTGLGLSSAYSIVKNHGGVITVYSEKGSGSTFHIYLPASAKAIETRQETAEEVAGGFETILLIDDEEMILDVARQMLVSLGYTVLTASSGAQALKIYCQEHERIDLVILDMIMPQMSGGKVFEALKGLDPQVRILLSSGYSINGQAMEIMRRGCRGFIQKPFSIRDLAPKLREVLSS
jgi:two-component system cell cycle sensor histidine kinase/response regulator CckA